MNLCFLSTKRKFEKEGILKIDLPIYKILEEERVQTLKFQNEKIQSMFKSD